MPELTCNSTPKHIPTLAPGLYVIATPIGNLGDITLRAMEVLAAADVLACEDTRTTRHLLQSHGIKASELVAYTEHNAIPMGEKLLARIAAGGRVGLVSEAGTPLVSDPGARLVEAARTQGLDVFPIPGACAPVAALMGAGMPSDAFSFHGFLPTKEGARRTALEALVASPATLVFFEAPHRVLDTLQSMEAVFGSARVVCVARELTKKFEEFRRATLAELNAHYATGDAPRGEIVLLVAPAPQEEAEEGFSPSVEVAELAGAALNGGMKLGAVADVLSTLTGQSRKPIYQWLLQWKNAQ
jgi:16S rRNA (cytidine1402-2'-O)-methyltransferase